MTIQNEWRVYMFEKFRPSGVSKKNEDAEVLFQYNRKYMEILHLYRDDIQYIEEELKKLRLEELDFYENQIVSIRNKLNDEGVEVKIIDDWIAKLEKNVGYNFLMSKDLLMDFVVQKENEFRKQIKEKVGV